MQAQIANELIEDIKADLVGAFGDVELDYIAVSAKMPSAVMSPYCHVRVYPSGGEVPKGRALRKMTDGKDYWEFRKVPVGGKTLRSEYMRIIEAVRQLNSAL